MYILCFINRKFVYHLPIHKGVVWEKGFSMTGEWICGSERPNKLVIHAIMHALFSIYLYMYMHMG